MIATLIGSVGVSLLLIAFVLNLLRILNEDKPLYALINFIGALLACISSVMIRFVPFIILEAVWAVAALIAFVRIIAMRNT